MAEQDPNVFRSNKVVKAIRMSKDAFTGKPIEIVADLPIGRGWQSGNGFIDYYNLGWREYDKVQAEKAAKVAEDKRIEAEKQKAVEEALKAKAAEDAAKKDKK